VIATDDSRIEEAAREFGAPCIMTSKNHNSGTNRCLEAYEAYSYEKDFQADVVINIQGDEPLLEADLLPKLAACFEDPTVKLATMVTPITKQKDLHDSATVKVVVDDNDDALYFSRSAIPFLRSEGEKPSALVSVNYLKHLGMYAYRPKALATFANLPMSSLEKAEALEQLRWIQSGRKIRVLLTDHDAVSVDTPEDLEAVRKLVQ